MISLNELFNGTGDLHLNANFNPHKQQRNDTRQDDACLTSHVENDVRYIY
jgi:hypothetical protein